MSKLTMSVAAIGLLALSAPAWPARAVVLGPDAAVCADSGNPAMLVRIDGFKARTGKLRVQSYGGDPKTFFEKGAYLKRIEVEVPRNGAAEVCVPVPQAGVYAVSVRHDVNGSGKTDRKDGGGMSGNPEVSVSDLIFKRKPKPSEVAVRVAGSRVVVPVVLNYIQGGSFQPIQTAGN